MPAPASVASNWSAWTPFLSPAVVSEPPTLVMFGARVSRRVKVAAWIRRSLTAPVGGHVPNGWPWHPVARAIELAPAEVGLKAVSWLAGRFHVSKEPRQETPVPDSELDPSRSTETPPAVASTVGVPVLSPEVSENARYRSPSLSVVFGAGVQCQARSTPTLIPAPSICVCKPPRWAHSSI